MSGQARWMQPAERFARARIQAVLETVEHAISEHAPDAIVEAEADGLRLRGRGMLRRWISEPGLRFALRLKR